MAAQQDGDLIARFRDAMATVCTPVAVVTAMDGHRPHGTTVSAFASLSMTPPSLLVSLDRGSELLGLVLGSGFFGMNVLGSSQSGLAGKFARKGADKFDGPNPPATLEPGMVFTAQGENGHQHITVKSVEGDKVMIDGNHEMAGQTLYFDVEVISIREATEEEIDHGHVHAHGDHHHH